MPSPIAAQPAQNPVSDQAASRVDATNTLSWACLAQSVNIAETGWQSGGCAPIAPRGITRGSAIGHPNAVASSATGMPSAPSGLSASVTAGTVTLRWLGAADAVSYIIEAGSAPGLTDRARFDSQSGATTIIVIDVPAGSYYVRVRSRNDGGLSAPSNEALVLVTGAACVPGAPAALNATSSGASVLLGWSAPAGTCTPASYVVEAGSAPGLVDLANFSTGSAATSFSAVGVASGTYYVRVRAATAAGTSGPSNEVSFTVGCPLVAPLGLIGNANGSTVALSWQPGQGGCAPTGYVIQAGSSPGLNNLANTSTGNTATTFTATGVADGIYYVRVRASIGSTLSNPSNEVVVVVRTTTPCSYAFSPSSASWTPIGGPGGTTRLSASCAWSLSTDVPWLTVTSPLSGATDGVVTYVVGANNSPASRTGRIVAQGAGGTVSFTVTQIGQPPAGTCSALIFEPSSQSVASGGGTYDTLLRAFGPFGDPGMCSWTLSSDSPWLTTTTQSGTGTAGIVLTVSPNSGGERTGAIRAAAPNGPSALYIVTQRAAGSPVSR